jgi:hypothetical protein
MARSGKVVPYSESHKSTLMREHRTTEFGDSEKLLEARGGIEPPIKVLQTFALPLGDRATES